MGKIVGIIRKAWFIIDWHDVYNNNSEYPAAKLARWYEKKFGTVAYAHLAASNALYQELNKRNVQGKLITVRDLPSADYKQLGLERAHHVWSFTSLRNIEKFENGGTLVTEVSEDGVITWRQNRPKIVVVSSCNDMFVNALELYEASAYPKDPQLLVVFQGASKAYLETIEKKDLKKVRVVTTEIAAGDYPWLLGTADLGVSLDQTTKGIMDMFGCGLPVCTTPFAR